MSEIMARGSRLSDNPEFKQFVGTMLEHLMPQFGKEVFRDFSFPVGINTTCTIKFDGPVAIDEWDSLLAHIAFYKTFYKKGVELDNTWTAERLARAFDDALDRRLGAGASQNNP